MPILLGGGGERRTLALAARYADAANVLGDLPTVARKAAVLRAHCAETGREVALSHLTTALVARRSRPSSTRWSRRHRPRGADPARWAAAVHAGTVDDQIGRFRELAEAGVGEVAVRLVDLVDTEPIARMAPVIAAFR